MDAEDRVVNRAGTAGQGQNESAGGPEEGLDRAGELR